MTSHQDVVTTPVSAGVSTQVIGRNPDRVSITFLFSVDEASWKAWFNQQTVRVGFDPPEGQSYVTLHRSIVGEIVKSEWYMVTDIPGTAYVIEHPPAA